MRDGEMGKRWPQRHPPSEIVLDGDSSVLCPQINSSLPNSLVAFRDGVPLLSEAGRAGALECNGLITTLAALPTTEACLPRIFHERI